MTTRKERLAEADKALRDVLSFLMPKDTEIADRLIKQFGTAGGVIEAGKYLLMRAGLSESNALVISMIPDLVRHLERQNYGPHPRIRRLIEAEKYLAYRYLGVNIEKYYLLSVDSAGRLIECVHVQSGDEDSAPFYLKQILAEVVRTKAAYVVLVHNHPNLSPQPSQADLDCTVAMIEALRILRIPLLDHMIMVGDHTMSIRGFGYLPDVGWDAQKLNDKLLHGWLEGWSPDEAVAALTPRR